MRVRVLRIPLMRCAVLASQCAQVRAQSQIARLRSKGLKLRQFVRCTCVIHARCVLECLACGSVRKTGAQTVAPSCCSIH